jgi:hypothetical protein
LKLKNLIPPLLALALVGAWLGTRRQAISSIERDSSVLRERIQARASGASADALEARPDAPGKSTKSQEAIDWKKVAASFAEMRSGNGMQDMRASIRLQNRLQNFTKEQLVSALDEIAALDLADADRDQLEQMLIRPLLEKDPEFTLNRFIDRVQGEHSSVGWQLSHGLQKWVEKDAGAAIAWFDAHIAAGKFDSKSLDGKSQSRIQFEGSVISSLLASDAPAAWDRLGALPEDQRAEALSRFQFTSVKEEDQLAFADLVRDKIPAHEQGSVLARQATQIVATADYDKVSDYFSRIKATPEERAACAEEAAEVKMRNYSQKKPTREDFETMRAWLSSEAPEAKDRITGEILGNAMQGGKKMEFSEASELAIHYHESSGNDEVLGAFLESWPARNHKTEARALAEKISDEKLRKEILKRLE